MHFDIVRRRLAEFPPADGRPEGEAHDVLLLEPEDLRGLGAGDLPVGCHIQVGRLRDGVQELELEGTLTRGTRSPLRAEMTPGWYRSAWAWPLALGTYLDLLRRAIESRQSIHGDVELGEYDGADDLWIHLPYTIHLASTDVAEAYAEAKRIDDGFRAAADAVRARVCAEVALAAKSLSGLAHLEPDRLLAQFDQQRGAEARGRILETLLSRLLETVPGFTVATATETRSGETELLVRAAGADPEATGEGALLLVECACGSSACGRNAWIRFRDKLRDRRLSCGLLVSWRGFARTVTRELRRGGAGDRPVLAITGDDLKEAVRLGSFVPVLARLGEEAEVRFPFPPEPRPL